ncbi:MAG: NFACT family protein [Lachnospiraceae bacterium]|nr:NFACT family protein [Lachnospiraceae bacterium]
MAFDGLTVNELAFELNKELEGARIQKIYQPGAEELLLVLKAGGRTFRLMMSAEPALPMIYLREDSGENPASAPNFCMLLRKHLTGGKIVSIEQPGLERIIIIKILHQSELGDVCERRLYTELMGRHSNIILTDSDDVIIDSIKRIPPFVSTVRTVLPGHRYFIPNTQDKADPLETDRAGFEEKLRASSSDTQKALYTSFTGLSPVISWEICHRAGVDERIPSAELSCDDLGRLYTSFAAVMDDMKAHRYDPRIYYENGLPAEYAAVELTSYGGAVAVAYGSMPSLLYAYYSEKARVLNMRQRSQDLRNLVKTDLERATKKLDLQLSQLEDSEKREKYRIWGELITAYGYSAVPGDTVLRCENYYDDNKPVDIPLNKDLSAIDNAKKYFERYNKLKRTFDSLTVQIEKTRREKALLESILLSIDLASTSADLKDIKDELTEHGYMKKRPGKSKKEASPGKSRPMHFMTDTGLDIYVGKNNYQNEDITFRLASGSDWWFHAKNTPGSHVILKCGSEMPDDLAFEQAARLAAHFSDAGNGTKAEVDYTQRKNLKKPPESAAGFVIYHTNYSMTIDTDISAIKKISG